VRWSTEHREQRVAAGRYPGRSIWGYETPPNVMGTYRGWYTERQDGRTVKGTVRIVVREKRIKITGSFVIRGHNNPLNTYFVGKVRETPQGAVLRFQVVWLGGYGNSVNMHAQVTGMTPEGEGRSQVRTNHEASRWKFRVTKVSVHSGVRRPIRFAHPQIAQGLSRINESNSPSGIREVRAFAG